MNGNVSGCGRDRYRQGSVRRSPSSASSEVRSGFEPPWPGEKGGR